ncbi:MAG: toprim domain-containing protein [Deltaproteobacteria bacterium]|nr:toprim domain-containing protein [Deltaproteobacteria bacterium]
MPGLQFSHAGKRLMANCPFVGHADKHPSFTYDPDKDRYRCFSHPDAAEASGDLVDLWARLQGIHDASQALKGFRAQYASDLAKHPGQGPGRDKRPSGATGGDGGKGKKERKVKVVPDREWDRLPPLPEAWIQRLEEKRGWSREVIQALDLRLCEDREGRQRIAIPIRDQEGLLVNVRKYLPGAPENKVVSWGRGFGEARLWSPPTPGGPSQGRIWLVEGEPDCLCAVSRGLEAITSTTGAGTWKPEWSRLFAGREVVICYDADDAGREGAAKIARALARAGARVRIIEWPAFMRPGQDLTDWFMAHGRTAAELEALADVAELVEGPEAESEGVAALQEAADALTQYKAWSEFDQETRFRPVLMVRDILQENLILTERKTKLIFRWDGRHWAASCPEDLKRLVMAKMGLVATRNRVAEGAELILAQTILPEGEEMDPRPELLCLLNGMLDLNTGRLLPHDPRHRTTYLYPYEWRPHDPPDCPVFKRYCLESLEHPGVIEEVLEFIGYCFWPGQHYKKALLLVGPKDCGKSLLQEVIRRLLGPDNCSAVDMADLEDQFQRVALHRKRANICGETSANFYSSNNFKKLTGGDPVQAAYKGVDSFTFNTQAKLIFASNEFPRVSEQSEAFYERILAVEFRRQFKLGAPGTDPHLLDKILAELPGIFHLAMAKLYHLRRRGAFAQCPESWRFLNQYKLENNHVARFLEERCVTENADGTVPDGPKMPVYGNYRSWCEDNGIKKPKASTQFWKVVRQVKPTVKIDTHGPSDRDPKRPGWVWGLYLREATG